VANNIISAPVFAGHMIHFTPELQQPYAPSVSGSLFNAPFQIDVKGKSL
jgi:hypothetical protein